MATCPAAIATAAIFTALIILDIANKNYNTIGLRVSGGIFSVIGIFVICQALGNEAGWFFLAVPFFVLLAGFLMIWIDNKKDSTPVVKETNPCMECGYAPCDCPYKYKKPVPQVPLCQASGETALPPSVTTVPKRPIQNTLGCPPKN